MTSEIEYLLSLEAVRERSRLVFAAAQRDELSHFIYHASKLPEAAAYVTSVINVSSPITPAQQNVTPRSASDVFGRQ